jgi:tetratricopeptide (TPR) repeat protein
MIDGGANAVHLNLVVSRDVARLFLLDLSRRAPSRVYDRGMAKGAKPGRNEPCPCGSGRKFKFCCGAVRVKGTEAALSTPRVEHVVRRAEGLLEASRYEEAILALHEAVRLVPDNAMVLFNLGSAYLVTQRFPEAMHYLLRSVALEPTFARAHDHLGRVMQEMGDDERALVAYRRALELAPELADVQCRVGDIKFANGLRQEARAAYELAFAAAPDSISGRLALAKALVTQDRLGDAEERLREIIARDPSNGNAHHVLAHVLDDLGRFHESVTHFERSLAVLPRQATAYLGLVRSKRLTEADRPLLKRILARIAAQDPNEFKQMTLHFAAGKALDDLGDYASAIEHFDAANRIRHRLARFNREESERRVDQLIARFTREFLARHAATGHVAETPVLILGMPRSGTTLLERIITSHPKVGGGGELDFWKERGPIWANAEVDKLEGSADEICVDYLRLLRGIAPDALRVTDKMPFNYTWVGLVHLLFPNARIIHSKRNPIDTCLSVYTTPFVNPRSWGFASDRGDLSWYYRQYVRLMDHWRSVLPSARLLEVDYEEATVAPEEVARRLIRFVGLDWDAACLSPEKNPDAIKTASKWQARQPIYRSSVERWRNYEPWLGELRDLLP